jgi:hypothetical protein
METRINNDKNYKVLLVYSGLEGNAEIESVWAEKAGEYYRILNVPFFAPNIAYGDIVAVNDEDGVLYFDELIQESGHSTIQMIIFDKDNQPHIESEIIQLGCNWEGSNIENYISMDVPPLVPYGRVNEYLTEGQLANRWDYKEACLSRIHKNS